MKPSEVGSVTLSAGHLRLSLSPSIGGAISAFEWIGEGASRPAVSAVPSAARLARSAGVTRAGRAAAATAAAVEPEPDARPDLSLVSEPAPRSVARAAVDRLAQLTGGQVEAGEGGLRTVHFPAPGRGDLTPAPYTVTRTIDAAPAPVAAPPATAPAPAAPAAGEPQEQPEMDLEAAYEYFLDRFKRDLIVEREQSGHLLIDNP